MSFTDGNPGDVSDILQVDVRNVTGNIISASTGEYRKGGLLLMPLPGQMLHIRGITHEFVLRSWWQTLNPMFAFKSVSLMRYVEMTEIVYIRY